ncbi:hypothetical protein KC909_02240 [Candidatus Dojkabacteria bacterium]|uniref:Guanylate kinase-like domain-containing protein n=1 Tax=Candidatus Dojkabacteria bacterium TaxID=2099670 RepID=A0A955L5N9_9BACT|nr:hypothetical protein [Candidatus Dojkabacteria bacterium]
MYDNTVIKSFVNKYPVRPELIVDIIVGPTSVGKSWVVDNLKETHQFVRSTTTRERRPGEDGDEYNFVTIAEFESRLKNHEFVLAFNLNDNYYGYLGDDLDKIVESGKKPISIIYYKVLDEFLDKFPNSRIAFMFPPNTQQGIELLRTRTQARDGEILQSREQDTLEQMTYAYTTDLSSKYSNSRFFVIEDNTSALGVIEFFKS